MYDELIKRLRYCGNAISCLHCPYWEECGPKEDLMQAADAIEELSKPRWIPVTEKLPEISTWVLTYRPTIETIWPAFLSSVGDWIDEDGIPIEVTYWMSLPKPPEEDKRCVTS